MSRVLVTGANGFVGRSLCVEMIRRGRRIKAAVRSADPWIVGAESVMVGSIDGETDWSYALSDVDVVVHLAARVHMMRETVGDPLTAFNIVNVAGAERLARAAAEAGVRRLVYVSSIKVNGERTCDTGEGFPEKFSATDRPQPENPYAVSKWEAEQALHTVARETGLDVVIIRPPLVYGPGVKANFYALLRAVAWGVPLPLGAISNRRSLVALDNLVDMIITCIDHPAATNQTFLVSDGEDISTTELIQRMARALGRPVWLIPVPKMVLMAGATLLGKQEVAARLCGSMQMDITKAREMLGWFPPITLDEGLRRTAEHYLQQQ